MTIIFVIIVLLSTKLIAENDKDETKYVEDYGKWIKSGGKKRFQCPGDGGMRCQYPEAEVVYIFY